MTDWMTNIIVFMLLAVVLEMLLPNTSLQKYVQLVMSLVLLLMMLTPVLKILHVNIDEMFSKIITEDTDTNFKKQLEMRKKEIQASNHAYIQEQMAVQMKSSVEKELLTRFQVVIDSMKVEAEDASNVRFVYLQLSEKTLVQPVEITKTNDYEKVIPYLAQTWQLQEKQIVLEGGK